MSLLPQPLKLGFYRFSTVFPPSSLPLFFRRGGGCLLSSVFVSLCVPLPLPFRPPLSSVALTLRADLVGPISSQLYP